jgi:glucose/arabinose dehydrogenase
MNRSLRSFSTTLLLLAAPLVPARAADPGPSQGPFTVAGTVAGVSLQQVAKNLGPITGISNAGDARLFLVVRTGRIVILQNGNVRPQPFLDIQDKITSDGEHGLLSVAFHPHYATNGFLFVDYTNLQGNTVIARYHVAASDSSQVDPASARILMTIAQPYPNHNGGQLQFGPDGDLYIGMGDGGSANDPECRAQDPAMLLGKILRIDVDQNVATPPYYGIPASNPFRGAGGPQEEEWASGVRNPWRFSFDRQTGDLWIGDVGQDMWEEVDHVAKGRGLAANFGWSHLEGTHLFNAAHPLTKGGHMVAPVAQYSHSLGCSITGGYVYRGPSIAGLNGRYVYADYCSSRMWTLATGSRTPTDVTSIANAGGLKSPVSFGQGSDGSLYVLSGQGEIFRFSAL